MKCYFDNSATTKVYDESIEIMVKMMRECYGNPSSLHTVGLEAEHYIKDATTIITRALKCLPEEVIFTSGGTESNNMAIIGSALAKKRKGKHIVVSSVEHASVSAVQGCIDWRFSRNKPDSPRAAYHTAAPNVPPSPFPGI